MEPRIAITHFTDPTCPIAFSAEPRIRRLEWLLGDTAAWRTCMVGLVESPEAGAARGMSAERLTRTCANLAASSGMPFGSQRFERLYESVTACLAVVATRRVSPDRESRLLRALRVRHFAGQPADDPTTIELAAADAGIGIDRLRTAMADRDSAEALADDLRTARRPSAAALAQPARLMPTVDGMRYTCPSLELTHKTGKTMSAPGLQPHESYDLAVANLDASIVARPPAPDARTALAWAPFPLATAEVAALCAVGMEDAEASLESSAERISVGTSTYWRLVS